MSRIDVERTLETPSVYVSRVREAVIRRASCISKTHMEQCGMLMEPGPERVNDQAHLAVVETGMGRSYIMDQVNQLILYL
jgi:hypothetical protein